MELGNDPDARKILEDIEKYIRLTKRLYTSRLCKGIWVQK